MIRQKKLPRDPMQRAKAIGDLATGLVEPESSRVSPATVQTLRKGGARGGPARIASPSKKSKIGKKAVKVNLRRRQAPLLNR